MPSLADCCTPIQARVVVELNLNGRSPSDLAREIARQTGEMVHPGDVRMAADIAMENLRAAHVCGV